MSKNIEYWILLQQISLLLSEKWPE